jgi:hypothetical protein
MANTHCSRRSVSAMAAFLTLAGIKVKQAVAVVATLVVVVNCVACSCTAQDQPQTSPDSQTNAQDSARLQPSTVTTPAGTRIALVLTHPVLSRSIHRGDDIYAQTTSAVTSGNEVVIPPGTLVQGKVDNIARKGGRGELRLQSMSLIFPDGYVAPIAGPETLESDEGYALKDPGQGRMVGMFALPAAGAGLGALIGHFAASSQPTTITSSLPPGCTGPPPGCLSSTLTGPPDRLKSTAIGSMVGLVAGGVSGFLLLTSSHNFFLDVGSPVEMVLQQPLSLPQEHVADAVRESGQHPTQQQRIAPRPVPSPTIDSGTCYTPDTPGTPPTVIPGTAPIGDSPGTPDIIIPGTPSIPGSPHPCP